MLERADAGDDTRWTTDSTPSEGLESIVRRTSPALIRTVTLVVLDRELAADIAQDAFVQLHRHWDRVAGHPNLDAWLYRVALNRATDYRRRLARAARLVERLGRNLPEDSGFRSWEPDFEFISVLRGLPKGQRTAAALRYLGDLSVPQVAGIMGISEGAVNSHLHRARLALKDLLAR
jgi:RNA polymerase sigma-70 factor (ECF subfamily)